MIGVFDYGVRLSTQGDHVVIADVNTNSIAHSNGLQPGMIVTRLNGVTLVRRAPLRLSVDPALAGSRDRRATRPAADRGSIHKRRPS